MITLAKDQWLDNATDRQFIDNLVALGFAYALGGDHYLSRFAYGAS